MAKGTIISQVVVEGVMDWAHGGGHRIRRLIVDGLALTHAQGTVFVFPWAEGDGGKSVKVIVEDVDVPDEVVGAAKQYLAAKTQIHQALDALGCSEEAAKARTTESINKFRNWAEEEKAKGKKNVVWNPHQFLED